MKLEFQAKFLQHLNKKKNPDQGFTLIELLVVIIIIGILAAIALPSLIAQVNKAKQAEAKQNVGALNRAQQAYFLEQTAFASDIVALGIGIQSQSVNYSYLIRTDASSQIAQNLGARLPNKNTLKSYVGLNYTSIGGATATANTEVLSLGRVCETDQPKDLSGLAAPTTNQSSCPQGYKDLGTGKST